MWAKRLIAYAVIKSLFRCFGRHHQRQLCFTHKVLSHICLGISLANSKALIELGDIHSHHQHITWHHRLAPPQIIHTSEEEVVLLRGIGRINHHNASKLRHGLHLQHSRHDGALGEVAGEEVVVDGDALVAHSVLAILPLQDTVNKQEWVSAAVF